MTSAPFGCRLQVLTIQRCFHVLFLHYAIFIFALERAHFLEPHCRFYKCGELAANDTRGALIPARDMALVVLAQNVYFSSSHRFHETVYFNVSPSIFSIVFSRLFCYNYVIILEQPFKKAFKAVLETRGHKSPLLAVGIIFRSVFWMLNNFIFSLVQLKYELHTTLYDFRFIISLPSFSNVNERFSEEQLGTSNSASNEFEAEERQCKTQLRFCKLDCLQIRRVYQSSKRRSWLHKTAGWNAFCTVGRIHLTGINRKIVGGLYQESVIVRQVLTNIPMVARFGPVVQLLISG